MLSGRTAIVTGAGTGIGREIALRLLALGVNVAGVGRREEPLQALGRDADAAGHEVAFEPIVCDVRREDNVRRAVDAARERFGRVSILINNAGVAEYASVAKLTTEVWNRAMETNLRGPFFFTREVLPEMLAAREGHVVMNVSVAGVKAYRGCGAYGASKFGLLGFTRVLREETLGTGVRVTAVIPGATATAMWEHAKAPPADRLMSPGSVADAVIWALSTDPRSVPEEIVLRPDGGDL